jgi:hypothetical protein
MGFLRPHTLRQWVIAFFAAAGVGLLPWTIWLASSLKPHHVTTRWDVAWSGFDTGLALLFLATAFAAYRRSPWVGALSAALGMMLLTDAWFDIILESHADELRFSILLAAFAEVPAALFCFWIAIRTERFLAFVVEEMDELHLAPAREGPPESDLVGVLEVAPHGETARKPGHADPPS